jgi:nucleoside-diphosphate-sugar epimerase
VHGHVERPPANEDAPLAPGDQYQRTKLEAEQLRAEFGSIASLDVVVARPVGIYGAGDTRFLKMFRGIARGYFPMLGSGKVFYHVTHVDDVVEGLRLCGETTPQPGARTCSPVRATRRSRTGGHDRARAEREAAARAFADLAGVARRRACEAVCVPLASSRRSIDDESISIARAARSTPRAHARNWGGRRRSISRAAFGGRSRGTASRGWL